MRRAVAAVAAVAPKRVILSVALKPAHRRGCIFDGRRQGDAGRIRVRRIGCQTMAHGRDGVAARPQCKDKGWHIRSVSSQPSAAVEPGQQRPWCVHAASSGRRVEVEQLAAVCPICIGARSAGHNRMPNECDTPTSTRKKKRCAFRKGLAAGALVRLLEIFHWFGEVIAMLAWRYCRLDCTPERTLERWRYRGILVVTLPLYCTQAPRLAETRQGARAR